MIDRTSLAANEHVYRVEMGHCAMDVRSESEEGAIAQARQRFMRELPRLWDVIQRLDPSQFKVTML